MSGAIVPVFPVLSCSTSHALPRGSSWRGRLPLKTLLFIACAYGVLWLSLAPAAHAAFPTSRRPTCPYGTYLYGWPIQQTLHALWPGIAAGVLLVPSLAITLLIAALSWYPDREAGAGLKARALGRRTLKTIEPAAP